MDWNHQEHGRAFVLLVGLLGFRLILNQTEPGTADRAGHARVFIGLERDQADAFHRQIREKDIETKVVHWGAPTLEICDIDGNELFIWLPESERASLGALPLKN